MSRQFEHLGLTRWPFQTVPNPKYCTYLADRNQLKSDVEDLLTGLSRRDISSIHLFWAWFGAGKTHTLYYLAYRAAQITKSYFGSIFHIVYSEFPKAAKSFIHLYRSFVVGLDSDALVDAFLEVSTCDDSDVIIKDLSDASLDLYSALHVMSTGQTQNRITALRWLRADPLPISEFRKIGISQKISTVEEATRILSAIIHLLNKAREVQKRAGRVIWLLDEYQRVQRSGPKGLQEINDGLHSTFNACPHGLSILLSFSGKPEANLPGWFSPELRDRIGRTKVFVLPPMLMNEALEFVRDVLAQFRTSSFNQDSPYFPFNKETSRTIISEIDKKSDIKPRAIMQAFSAVLEEADRLIERGEMDIISPDFANQVLSERILLTDDIEDE